MRTALHARLACAAIAAALLGGCERKQDPIDEATRQDAEKPGLAEVEAIAEEAYVYGFPMIAAYKAMYEFSVDAKSPEYKGPFNTIQSETRTATPQDTAVVTPNADTPYSMLQVDLRAEPIVFCVPEVETGRYYSVQLTDMYAFNYGYVGSRSTGNGAGCYLVAGPGWKGEAPAGVARVLRSETEFGLVIFRTQLFDAGDMENVRKIQAGYRVQPLSAFLGQAAPPAAPAIEFPAFVGEEPFKTGFPAMLDFLLNFAPEVPEESELRARLASIGIGPGKRFDFDDLSLEHRTAVGRGIERGFAKISQAVEELGNTVNGWHVGSAFGDRAFYHGDWLLRAAAAKAGIYGNDAAEATYPMTTKDGSGQPLDGSQHRYTLTFAKDELPPVNAFWSVTMYDGKTQLLVANPLDRYLINSPMLPALARNADGSITLQIQKDSPGKDAESNWLPAPNGPIYLVMRLYWPKPEPPSILPPGRGSWQPPPVVRVD